MSTISLTGYKGYQIQFTIYCMNQQFPNETTLHHLLCTEISCLNKLTFTSNYYYNTRGLKYSILTSKCGLYCTSAGFFIGNFVLVQYILSWRWNRNSMCAVRICTLMNICRNLSVWYMRSSRNTYVSRIFIPRVMLPRSVCYL